MAGENEIDRIAAIDLVTLLARDMRDGDDEVGALGPQRLGLIDERRDRRQELEVAGIGRARAVLVGRAGEPDAHAADGHDRAVLEVGQRRAVRRAQVRGVARKPGLAHALEEDRLAEIVFVVAGREDVGPHHVGQRHDARALVDARHQGGRERIAGMGEDRLGAGGISPRALGLDHRRQPREPAAALAVRHHRVRHQIDVIDQDERHLRRGGRRLRARKACADRNKQQAGGDAAGDQHGSRTVDAGCVLSAFPAGAELKVPSFRTPSCADIPGVPHPPLSFRGAAKRRARNPVVAGGGYWIPGALTSFGPRNDSGGCALGMTRMTQCGLDFGRLASDTLPYG